MTNQSNLERAREFLAGSHYCDFGVTMGKWGYEHPHQGCECPCSLCHSFWHPNIWRYEEAKKLVAAASDET